MSWPEAEGLRISSALLLHPIDIASSKDVVPREPRRTWWQWSGSLAWSLRESLAGPVGVIGGAGGFVYRWACSFCSEGGIDRAGSRPMRGVRQLVVSEVGRVPSTPRKKVHVLTGWDKKLSPCVGYDSARELPGSVVVLDEDCSSRVE